MYNVSVSPHVREQSTTQSIMRDVIIALLPILAFGVYHFGIGALQVIIISVVTCVIGEILFDLAVKKPVTVFDGSAVVTGLILAINLPATAIWWMPVLGGLFAIVAVKMLFGGLGQNFMNPALAARCFLLISFSGRMTDFTMDGVSSATPLAAMKAGELPDLLSLFLGFHGGCIGEVSALAIFAGGIYLIVKKVISVRIPLTYILSTAAFILLINLINGGDISTNYLLAQVLSGGLLVGAFFMATDYATSPITPKGQLLYGILLGLFTALFRTVGSSAEGVSYAIIICNLLVPLIENITIPKPFGSEKAKGGSKA
ncbi:RnfABCDGE type electron transport complex subunit D [Anaerovoracaceae bacterium 41-7]|jgi:electron transport complex protein RnfD|uniref:Ion-translocating oxidoreductase complex subunit D n=1 Tax=Anaerotruncus colihominis TaxID=169435 RepID=A0A845QJJ8_9FIRM|nr:MULTISPECIES: RnfABCDGE type electron transport complex subunit D [Eubacteriales]MCI9475901.1 RnfABCDGE type electron transport complex subunit D [Emergencia sp.]NBH61205.1 RnfABCDGE type electron transport complex subunit D [Anaerotruncus colihominis]NCF01860.1 RnfABCDGE type electron transport complex subunit D [Anaerotruncus sp. 80]